MPAGVSVDFEGDALRDRPLTAGRTSVIHAANAGLATRLLALVRKARERAGLTV